MQSMHIIIDTIINCVISLGNLVKGPPNIPNNDNDTNATLASRILFLSIKTNTAKLTTET